MIRRSQSYNKFSWGEGDITFLTSLPEVHMQYRIQYSPSPVDPYQEVVVSNLIAVHAMIDYCNKWKITIATIEVRQTPRQKWQTTGITQKD